MMSSGVREEEGEITQLQPSAKSLAAAVSSSSTAAAAGTRPPLHNFSFPSLSWGSRRLLRCVHNALQPPTLMLHQPSSPPNDDEKEEDSKTAGNDEAGDSPSRGTKEMPWNLRTRRAACRSPAEKRPLLPMSMTAAAEGGMRRKFSLEISKVEIEEDFLMLRGTRPPRRPKKRQRNIQKQLDMLFPGLWLSEITLDMYS